MPWKKKKEISGAQKRIQEYLRQNKLENKRFERQKLFNEIAEDVVPVFFISILPTILIILFSHNVYIGLTYGLSTLFGYGIGKDIGYKKAKGQL